jgi:hypothetical protein
MSDSPRGQTLLTPSYWGLTERGHTYALARGRGGQASSMVNPAACRRPGRTEPISVAGGSTPAWSA